MVSGWVRTLHCKSGAAAAEDVIFRGPPATRRRLLPLDCAKPSTFISPKNPLPLPAKPPISVDGTDIDGDDDTKQRRRKSSATTKAKRIPSLSPSPAPEPATGIFPTLKELPAGHSSRRVVEIIFSSSWSHPFPAEIEMLFRVHQPPLAVARFEDRRAAVRSAGGGGARLSADGNEMMRFHVAPPPSSSSSAAAVYDAAVAVTASGIRTFAGSGAAHDCGGRRRTGRRSMLVCRVIAGRVRPGPAADTDDGDGFESVAGSGAGELVVFDPRAVLPCFLIVYRVPHQFSEMEKMKFSTSAPFSGDRRALR